MPAIVIAFVIAASGPLGYQAASAIRTHLAASTPCLAETHSPQAARMHIHVRTSAVPLGVQAYTDNVQAYSDGSYTVEAVAILDGRPVATASASSTSTTVWVSIGAVTLRLPLGSPAQAAESAARQLASRLRHLCQAPAPEQDRGPAS
jgi:hypothetical protein